MWHRTRVVTEVLLTERCSKFKVHSSLKIWGGWSASNRQHGDYKSPALPIELHPPQCRPCVYQTHGREKKTAQLFLRRFRGRDIHMLAFSRAGMLISVPPRHKLTVN